MNSSTLKSKRILIPTGPAVLALGIGGVAWAGTASAGDVRGEDRDRDRDKDDKARRTPTNDRRP